MTMTKGWLCRWRGCRMRPVAVGKAGTGMWWATVWRCVNCGRRTDRKPEEGKP